MKTTEKHLFTEMIHQSFITAKISQCVNLHMFLRETDGMKERVNISCCVLDTCKAGEFIVPSASINTHIHLV